MKINNDSIVLESRNEVSLLQNICDDFLLSLSKSTDKSKEEELAKELSALLDAMWYSW